MKAREAKRQRLVAKYAAKRAQLKKEGNYEALQALPHNASPVRLHNRWHDQAGIEQKQPNKHYF